MDDLISRQAAIEEVKRFAGYLDDDMILRLTIALKKVPSAQQWIPVSERLPENAKHKGAFCPRYWIMTVWGATEGWLNPDRGMWAVLIWHLVDLHSTQDIDLDRGDRPAVLWVPPQKVLAWMPLPGAYKEET